ncbi:sensor protein KdpD [Umezakia ovalisporum]|jgi:two-component system sensor histidine kinase KdpD|uniref:Sensor histidine kinase KdpD n=2 Tax=Umezakia ovalisporum TaxID=75695 RepID=A0AA43H0T8_9CYAN|nr:sensor histidine kinase KdpD [Umezakia ovalisporum]MBI1241932.1 sensor histidine kinase KdpD [Nostoc sp. RI_552]MDH6058526.1 sensor histidine kinase KdpD [Umezakia ovalisporum FSS-43]MDH6064988.1 sensor histidine kinase KdpD [Umezakia ovalisporum FSS-62]MDH6067619.1 sensor histidine kinase KdpD [Umezakia ovalisporum APH033B]MDH6069449.1 sensor histidine kinase KdpD [Umezakia ovalisporum CobakiLakeA]
MFYSSDNIYILPSRRGKHKIFIGMAPGVGKTYKMLEEAHELKQDGIDVVIGILETHGRKETAMKAAGIELIPQKACIHHNVTLQEMDTDAILQRSPQLVLVDELAHTNVPGSPREKRYQDVEAILAAGIDVYSTVNIQHLESLNDLVARITGVVVRERIPDYLLDEADAVIVIDVTPETLEERLQEGKIYAPEKIEQSLKNFFQRGNLIALRELALREVADTIEEEANSANLARQHCTIHEQVLVCVSTYPDSVQLLRRGARIANYMNARLYAVFVGNPERFLTKEESLHIDTCEKLCRDFGGEFLHYKSQNVANTIAQVAIDHHITQIIVGESQQPSWKRWLKVSFTQRLMNLIRHKKIDLHIISTDK